MTLSENPARVAGLTHTGRIAVGLRADLLLFESNLTLTTTLVAGTVAYQRT